MNKKTITLVATAVCLTFATFGHNGYNHWLAGNIVGSVAYAISGPRVVVAQPTVVAAPTTVVAPTTYTYDYYNGVYCPVDSGYYYYNNAWVWGGRPGIIPPPPPRWIPRPGFHGPRAYHLPPMSHPPVGHGFHHGGPRPGGFHGGPRPGGFHGGHHHRR